MQRMSLPVVHDANDLGRANAVVESKQIEKTVKGMGARKPSRLAAIGPAITVAGADGVATEPAFLQGHDPFGEQGDCRGVEESSDS